MNQEYRERVKRHLEAGGDPKYVNVKRKAEARHNAYAKSEALEKAKGGKTHPRNEGVEGGYEESRPASCKRLQENEQMTMPLTHK